MARLGLGTLACDLRRDMVGIWAVPNPSQSTFGCLPPVGLAATRGNVSVRIRQWGTLPPNVREVPPNGAQWVPEIKHDG